MNGIINPTIHHNIYGISNVFTLFSHFSIILPGLKKNKKPLTRKNIGTALSTSIRVTTCVHMPNADLSSRLGIVSLMFACIKRTNNILTPLSKLILLLCFWDNIIIRFSWFYFPICTWHTKPWLCCVSYRRKIHVVSKVSDGMDSLNKWPSCVCHCISSWYFGISFHLCFLQPHIWWCYGRNRKWSVGNATYIGFRANSVQTVPSLHQTGGSRL